MMILTMKKEAEASAEEDKKKREAIEAKNNADNDLSNENNDGC